MDVMSTVFGKCDRESFASIMLVSKNWRKMLNDDLKVRQRAAATASPPHNGRNCVTSKSEDYKIV